MRMIHNGSENKYRMPLFLLLELSKEWIREDMTAEHYQEILNYEMPSDQLEHHPVFTIRSEKPPDDKLRMNTGNGRNCSVR